MTYHNLQRVRRGFTLVELLVVVGIIAVLIGILMPVLNGVRRNAERTACASNLRQLGQFFQMYLTDSKNFLPRVNTMPSIMPPLNDGLSIVALFEPYAHSVKEAYHCRADRIMQPAPLAPPGYSTYFEREGSSYSYDPMLSAMNAGMPMDKTRWVTRGRNVNDRPIMYDYEPFHGKAGTRISTNYLFIDGRVDYLDPPEQATVRQDQSTTQP